MFIKKIWWHHISYISTYFIYLLTLMKYCQYVDIILNICLSVIYQELLSKIF